MNNRITSGHLDQSSYVTKSDLGSLVGDMHVRQSLPPLMTIDLLQKKPKQGMVWRYDIYFSENPHF